MDVTLAVQIDDLSDGTDTQWLAIDIATMISTHLNGQQIPLSTATVDVAVTEVVT